jgi:hypothetical protein
MFLLRKLMVLLVLEQMVLICLPHLRSDEMVHPRYFADHDKLDEWESKWLMKFHPEKCNVLTIYKKRSPSKYNSTLHGHILEHDKTVVLLIESHLACHLYKIKTS